MQSGKAKRDMMREENKKNIRFDIILVAVLLLIALSAFLIYKFVFDIKTDPTDDATVVIRIGNDEVVRESLYKDATYEIGDSNVVKVLDGKVWMESSTCPGYQDCVEEGKIYLVGDKIICLPNRVSVYIE